MWLSHDSCSSVVSTMSNWMNSGSKWMEGVKNLVVGTKVIITGVHCNIYSPVPLLPPFCPPESTSDKDCRSTNGTQDVWCELHDVWPLNYWPLPSVYIYLISKWLMIIVIMILSSCDHQMVVQPHITRHHSHRLVCGTPPPPLEIMDQNCMVHGTISPSPLGLCICGWWR